MGSQWRSSRIGVMWLYLREHLIRWAAAFCTNWSLLRTYLGILYKENYNRQDNITSLLIDCCASSIFWCVKRKLFLISILIRLAFNDFVSYYKRNGSWFGSIKMWIHLESWESCSSQLSIWATLWSLNFLGAPITWWSMLNHEPFCNC